MSSLQRKQEIPGYIALGLVTLTTALWVFWGVAEMYYEGWWGAWYNRLPYLIPGTICLLLSLVVLRWPRFGGWMIIVVGAAFTIWWWSGGTLTWRRVLSTFPASALLVFTGVLFLLDGRQRRRRRAAGWTPPQKWMRRNWRYLVVGGVSLAIFIGVSVAQLPIVLTRMDDGDRGARLIEGNGVTLVWAPQGPGWNWKQPWGGYPSWNAIARYGMPPVGLDKTLGSDPQYATQADMETRSLCHYLSEDGRVLMDEPQNVWRMPTTAEVVGSLCRHGQNAGCEWAGEKGFTDCRQTPDKETPLWAPDENPIYYWTADESDDGDAYYVSYNGAVQDQPKTWGNPRHGYRCVREP